MFSPGRKVLYVSTPRNVSTPAIRAFSETDFWIYSVTLYAVDRLNIPSVKYLHGSLDLGLLVLQYLHFLIFSAFSHEKTGTR